MNIESEDLKLLVQGFDRAITEHRVIIGYEMRVLGDAISRIMRERLSQHRYTGALDSSVKYAYDPTALKVEIGPTAKRGRYDAGLLLERGTRPIPNLPFPPIARWAAFRGLPAGAVWWKIKTEGVDPHPWLEDVRRNPLTEFVIRDASQKMGIGLISYALQDLPGGGFAGPISGYGGD